MIPKPTVEDLKVNLEQHYLPIYYANYPLHPDTLRAVLRRCHHAEREAERLRARVAELEAANEKLEADLDGFVHGSL